MYHELETAGRPLCQDDAGYVRYVITDSEFRRQIGSLRDAGFIGLSVSEALGRDRTDKGLAITFDDGSETDLTVAAPLLKDLGFKATFYVVAAFLGRRGYLSEAQVIELAGMGFEIGCHSMSHRFLPGLSDDDLNVEIAEAKVRLEEIIGKPVDHFSCPGGRWSMRAARVAREAGYKSMATSRTGVNSAATDRFSLARIAVKRETTLEELGQWRRGEGLIARKARESLFAAAKGVLGTSTYEKVRSRILDKSGN